MVADRHRTGAYVEALRRAVRPGSFVLDIGAGCGVFSLVACRLGARRVVAVEPDDVILVAREIAAGLRLRRPHRVHPGASPPR